jgi:hypothetical protein
MLLSGRPEFDRPEYPEFVISHVHRLPGSSRLVPNGGAKEVSL